MPKTMSLNDFGAFFSLLKGEPGTRKSTAALSWPGPQYWFSHDKKMDALQLPARKWGIDLSKHLEYDDYGDYDAMRVQLEKFETNCKYKTLIVDSLTSNGDSINRQVQKKKGANAYSIGGIPVESIEDYKAESSAIREILSLLNSIRKYHKIHIVMIAHVVGQRTSNDANKMTHHSRVLVTGGDKISAKISAYADEAYHFNIRPGATESSPGDYTCITAHTGNDYARTSLELPREIVFNDQPLFSKWIGPAIEKMKSVQK